MKNRPTKTWIPSYVKVFILFIAISATSCSREELETTTDETASDEVVTDEDLTSRCTTTGYEWLGSSPNNNDNWKLQYQGKEARRVGGDASFYTIANSRFEVVGSSCNRLRFRVDDSDPTTSGSSNPRSELREMRKLSSSGKEKTAGWSYTSTKYIDIDFKVREMTSSGRLSVAQIHSGQDDISQISVDKLSNGKYKVSLIVEGDDGPEYKTLYDNASSGTRFKIRMKIEGKKVKARKLTSGSSYTSAVTIKNSSKYRTSTCYFKAGAYLIGASSGKAKVEFYKIKTSGAQSY
ncbi:polysaccharide lyase family 7 protein [Sungkyunkwania multivorans]|uniref:Polysaccharide lyase family 7 protein n=1 Tax=Sungkyunkwania multivorans TaxID=1173618 RepID=A0ABW3CVR7_9FLAO